jgi:hypothetical protein
MPNIDQNNIAEIINIKMEKNLNEMKSSIKNTETCKNEILLNNKSDNNISNDGKNTKIKKCSTESNSINKIRTGRLGHKKEVNNSKLYIYLKNKGYYLPHSR